jgi:hypothetical protein
MEEAVSLFLSHDLLSCLSGVKDENSTSGVKEEHSPPSNIDEGQEVASSLVAKLTKAEEKERDLPIEEKLNEQTGVSENEQIERKANEDDEKSKATKRLKKDENEDEMHDIKMVLVVRNDLKMGKGKMCAQVSLLQFTSSLIHFFFNSLLL